MVRLGVVYGLGQTVLQILERGTGGWGVALRFFRCRGAWTARGTRHGPASFALLVLLFLYGVWYGLVYRRWSLRGLVAFIAAQVLVALAAVVAVSMTHQWPAVGEFFTTLTAPALTGVLAAIAVAVGLGGFITIRRVTV
jgi:hypothetical protein